MILRCSLPFLNWLADLRPGKLKYDAILALNRLAAVDAEDAQTLGAALAQARTALGPSQKIDLIEDAPGRRVIVYPRLLRSRRHRLAEPTQSSQFEDWDHTPFIGDFDEIKKLIAHHLEYGDPCATRFLISLMTAPATIRQISAATAMAPADIEAALAMLNEDNAASFMTLLKIIR